MLHGIVHNHSFDSRCITFFCFFNISFPLPPTTSTRVLVLDMHRSLHSTHFVSPSFTLNHACCQYNTLELLHSTPLFHFLHKRRSFKFEAIQRWKFQEKYPLLSAASPCWISFFQNSYCQIYTTPMCRPRHPFQLHWIFHCRTWSHKSYLQCTRSKTT